MSELDLVIQSIRAAKAANLAALHALEAVERLLGSSNTEEPVSKTEQPVDRPPLVVSDVIPDGVCRHTDAVKVSTTQGSFMVCDCGVQQEI